MQRNIAILGAAGSGKTTIAKYIERVGWSKYRRRYHQIALADKVKDIQRELFPNLPGKPRHVLQHIGMSMREIDANVWINQVDRYIANSDDSVRFVIPDIRLSNEYEHYKSLGWYMVRVVSPDDDRINRMRERDGDVNMDALNHITEHALDDAICDATIYNDGTVDGLYAKVDEVMIRLE